MYTIRMIIRKNCSLLRFTLPNYLILSFRFFFSFFSVLHYVNIPYCVFVFITSNGLCALLNKWAV